MSLVLVHISLIIYIVKNKTHIYVCELSVTKALTSPAIFENATKPFFSLCFFSRDLHIPFVYVFLFLNWNISEFEFKTVISLTALSTIVTEILFVLEITNY